MFYVMGGLGLLLVLVWNRVIYGPKAHPWVNQTEIDYIRAGGALVDLDGQKATAKTREVDTFACLKELLGNRMLLGLYVFQHCINDTDLFLPDVVPGLPRLRAPHDHPESRICEPRCRQSAGSWVECLADGFRTV